MKPFFDQAGPVKRVTRGSAAFDLPVLYFRDDAFTLIFTADRDKVTAALPSDGLHPVLFSKDKALVAIAAFNYIDTTIGPYGELAIAIPAVYGRDPARILPLLLESRYPGFGLLVMHLPVTRREARDAGRGEWGYPKFLADMRFAITPEFMECKLSEHNRHIMTVRAPRGGLRQTDTRPLTTYSVKDGDLLRTTMPHRCTYRARFRPSAAFLELGDHPVADSVAELGISKRPLVSRYATERFCILPSGEVVERNVRPLDGHVGSDREGELLVSYVDSR